MMNPCLRPACLSDVVVMANPELSHFIQLAAADVRSREAALIRLFNYEWRKRGFEGSP